MAVEYEPLERVRKEFRLGWYRCPLEASRLKELTRRSDLRGALQAVGHLLLTVATGWAAWTCFGRRWWPGFALALFAHGTVYSFYAGLATHELVHGTVFRTKGVNELFLRLFSLVSWFAWHDYRLSHTYHHLYTLHPRGDREVVLPSCPNLHPLFLLQLFTLNLVGGRGEPYSYPLVRVVGDTVRLALTGRFGKEWLEAVYAGHDEARRRAVGWARLVLGFHAALVAASVAFGLWPLPLLVTFAPFTANWLRYFVGVPMHTGLRDNVQDFRLCVRTIALDPFSRFLYWSMNWHTEHHMFAAVPCYRLSRLHRAVADDMPRPRTLLGAWREMRQTWKRQQADPRYQFDTPLPGKRADGPRAPGSLESSLGDLSRDTIG